MEFVLLILLLLSSVCGDTKERSSAMDKIIRFSRGRMYEYISDPGYWLWPNLFLDMETGIKCEIQSKSLKCVGNTLPYSATSKKFVASQLNTIEKLEAKLKELENAAKLHPECWKLIQPLLCSVFKPPCNFRNHPKKSCRLYCDRVQEPCSALISSDIWPDFLYCDNEFLFSPNKCPKELKHFNWNTEITCPKHLVPTTNPVASTKEFSGCGLQCQDPFYSEQDHQNIGIIICCLATTCAIMNILAILTYAINWKEGTYPDRALMYINCCFLVFCVGWLLQFTVFSKEDIVCREDNTLRTSETLSLETSSLPCLITFVLVFFPFMAITMWLFILSLMWYLKLEAIDTSKKFDAKNICFYALGWLVPLIVTILMIYPLQAVDGYSITGVCFVSSRIIYRFPLVLYIAFLPLLIVFTVSGILISTRILKMGNFVIKCRRLSLPINIKEFVYTIADIIVFWAVNINIFNFFIYNHMSINDLNYELFETHYSRCTFDEKSIMEKKSCDIRIPNNDFTKLTIEIYLIFFAGIFMSYFLWTKSTLASWVKFFNRICHRKEKIAFKKLPSPILSTTTEKV